MLRPVTPLQRFLGSARGTTLLSPCCAPSLSATTSFLCRDGRCPAPPLFRPSPTTCLSFNATAPFSRQQRTIVKRPRKAAVHLTPKAREVFHQMIAATKSEGILLKYELSTKQAMRMTFKFDLIKDRKKELTDQDEGVSLEVLEDGITPKPPAESWDDGLPKLYIHSGAFMKVLGGKLDVDFNSETGDLTPKLFDRQGFELDPNA